MQECRSIMKLKTLALTVGLLGTIGSTAVADSYVDPAQLLTHQVKARINLSYYNDVDNLYFDPASTAAECAHADLNQEDIVDAYLGVTTHCESSDSDIDMISFDWENTLSPYYSHVATGKASSMISAGSDAEISLASVTNLNWMSSAATWSIKVYAEDSTYLGDLASESIALAKDMCYEVVLSIGGANTRTNGGRMVTWAIQMEYSESGGGSTAVPGFGGLAVLTGLGAVRRRRRR